MRSADDTPTTRRFPRTLDQAFGPYTTYRAVEVGPRPWWCRFLNFIRKVFAS